jgi:tetratricopeptide (TPR) repeat protein
MPGSSNSVQSSQPDTTQRLERAVWAALLLLAAVVLCFAGYYVWDRYIYLGDTVALEQYIDGMEETIRDDPQNPEARLLLAESYLRSSQYEEALDQAVQVLNLYPDNESALLLAGMAQLRLGHSQDALNPLERLVALRRGEPLAPSDTILEAAYYFLGESYLQLDQPAKAIPPLKAALLISPTDADALYQAGLAFQSIGEPQTALSYYHQAVRMVPDFVEAYAGMVDSYSASDQPDHERYARGMIAFCLQDYHLSISYLEDVTKALPEFGPAFLGAGLAYEQLGQPDEASAALERALQLDPDDFAAQQALGRTQAILEQGN